MKKLYYIPIVLFLIFQGCQSDEQLVINEEIKSETAPESSAAPADDFLHLSADNSKWKVNPETDRGMKKIARILADFEKAGSKKPDFKKLSQKLSDETSLIVKECDMKGPALDQLHLVLMPIIRDITALADADTGQGKALTDHIKAKLTDYNKFFQSGK